jgi:hypothetical protein
MHLKNVACGAENWINLSQDRGKGWALSNTVRKFRAPYNAVKLFTRGGTARFPRRNFMFEFPCIIILYYIKNQQEETLAVLFISNCKITLHVSDAFYVHHQEY